MRIDSGGNNRFTYDRISGGAVVGGEALVSANTWGTGTWNIRVRCVGSQLKAKVWQGTEPAGWNYDVTNAVLASGQLMLSSMSGNAATATPSYWDDLIVMPASAAAVIPAPVLSSSSFVADTVGADPKSYSMAGLTWVSGPVFALYGGNGSVAQANPTSVTATDDTVTRRADKSSNAASLYVHELTVNSGALDANLIYDMSSVRRSVAAFLAFTGATGPDLNASNFVLNQGTPTAGAPLPSCLSFTVDANNCLIFAVMNVRGAHVLSTKPPTAPSGYTLVGQLASATDNVTSTGDNTLAVAVRNTPSTAGEVVPAATFGGLTSLGVNPWQTVHFAVAP
jgi:hypothetical protein